MLSHVLLRCAVQDMRAQPFFPINAGISSHLMSRIQTPNAHHISYCTSRGKWVTLQQSSKALPDLYRHMFGGMKKKPVLDEQKINHSFNSLALFPQDPIPVLSMSFRFLV